MHFEWWQWAILCFGAFIAGLSKGGIAGLSVLNVAIFALMIPARQSVGMVLTLYICTDVVAVTAYRRHASWPHLWRLFPTAALGVIIGYFALGRVNDAVLRRLIGAVLLLLVLWELARRLHAARAQNELALGLSKDGAQPDTLEPKTGGEAPSLVALVPALAAGLAGGFTTMVANAAGPLTVMYLLAAGLPKMQLVGTAAWFFLVINLFKAPFSYHLGLLNVNTLHLVAPLVPFSICGALTGRFVIKYIPQKTFEVVALSLTLLASVRLLWT